jgi:hypothetical protein
MMKPIPIIALLDCQSFYASVEKAANPELADQPLAVCGDPSRRSGIVLAACPIAKRYGVTTAERIGDAVGKCPGLIVVQPHMAEYIKVSLQITDIYRTFSDLVEPFSIDEQFVDLLDLGNAEKMTTIITEAVRTADSENEDILNGVEVAEPQEWEDHIIHWRLHSKYIQKRSFKEEVPPEYREVLISHIATHEFAMMEKSRENPLFQAKLAQLELFPIFYKDGFIPQSAEQQTALVQGASNRGEQTSAQIPGQEVRPNILDKGDK